MNVERIEKIAQELSLHESIVLNLSILSTDEEICPFCLNQIDWDKLNELKNKHQKEIHSLNKELVDLSK